MTEFRVDDHELFPAQTRRIQECCSEGALGIMPGFPCPDEYLMCLLPPEPERKAAERGRGVEILTCHGAVYGEEDQRLLAKRNDLRVLTGPTGWRWPQTLRESRKKDEVHA